MQVVELKVNNTKEALDVIDALRKKVESGEICAFAAVGIDRNDGTTAWMASTMTVSKLRMVGAIQHLFLTFWHGDVR